MKSPAPIITLSRAGTKSAGLLRSGRDAWVHGLLAEANPQLVLLDIGLPGMDGLAALRQLRRQADLPVIFVTARRRELEQVLGLELGADDYVTKPFDVEILLARIKAVLRRTRTTSQPLYDASSGAYHTVETDPFTVTVVQGSAPVAAAPQPPAAATEPTGTAEEVSFSLKPVTGSLHPAGPDLPAQPWYWLLWALPMAALTGGMAWQRRQTHLERNAAHIRSSRAGKTAHKALKQARQAAPADRAAAVHGIFVDFLSAKLHRPVAGLTLPGIGAALAERGVEAALIQRTLESLGAVEAARFSPAVSSPATVDALLASVDSLVSALDDVLR